MEGDRGYILVITAMAEGVGPLPKTQGTIAQLLQLLFVAVYYLVAAGAVALAGYEIHFS